MIEGAIASTQQQVELVGKDSREKISQPHGKKKKFNESVTGDADSQYYYDAIDL